MNAEQKQQIAEMLSQIRFDQGDTLIAVHLSDEQSKTTLHAWRSTATSLLEAAEHLLNHAADRLRQEHDADCPAAAEIISDIRACEHLIACILDQHSDSAKANERVH